MNFRNSFIWLIQRIRVKIFLFAIGVPILEKYAWKKAMNWFEERNQQ